MTALLAFLVGNPALLAIAGAIIAALGFGVQQRRAGTMAERARQMAAEAAARDIADQVQNDIGTLPADQARKELRSWARS